MPEELLGNSDLMVFQHSSSLVEDESRENCWLLEKVGGQVLVRWNEDDFAREIKIELGEEEYLLFRLTSQSQNQGRRVKSLASGSYIVVCPANWKRVDDILETLPVTPESVRLTGYQAHFYIIGNDSVGKISFLTSENKSVIIEPKASLFELVGTRLIDGNEDVGPLFGEQAPRVRALGDQVWKDVGTVVVGQEGGGENRWRTTFIPVEGLIEQDLPSEIMARKAGWYFLRFYDTNDDLMESLDFRFIYALREIRVFQPSPLPPENGHKPVCAEFFHEPNCVVRLADGSSSSIPMEHRDDKTVVIIPPDPSLDEIRWLIGSELQVPVTTIVERLWWAVSDEDVVPVDWKDQDLVVPRDSFTATSNKTLWLRFPRRRWISEILLGLGKPNARTYTVKTMEKTVAIPLRDFGDAQEMSAIGTFTLKLWIDLQATIYTRTLCNITVKAACKFCHSSAFDNEQDVFSHLESLHMDEFFRALTYEEIRHRIPSLPLGIYKCSYCPIFVKSDDPRNPTSTIIRHVEQDCKNVRRGIGPIHIRYRTIYDVDEIRNNIISSLPRIHACRMCGSHLDEAASSDMMMHLVENHRNALYELR